MPLGDDMNGKSIQFQVLKIDPTGVRFKISEQHGFNRDDGDDSEITITLTNGTTFKFHSASCPEITQSCRNEKMMFIRGDDDYGHQFVLDCELSFFCDYIVPAAEILNKESGLEAIIDA
jgi:hypothetical protein